MDRYKQMSTFVQVALRGSLSAAARHEGVAPALVSRRMDGLETRLGVKLMQRSTRNLTLTSEGSAFFEDCQRVLREINDAEAAVSARSVEATGRLRVSAPAGFGRKFVAKMVGQFAVAQPRVNVSLELDDRLVDLVTEGFDCAIRFGEHADNALVRIKLADSLRVIVAAPAYLQRHGQPATPEDLGEHQCLMLGDAESHTGPRGWRLRGSSSQPVVTLRPAAAASCNDGTVLHAWALDGMGLAWRSWWEVGDDVAQGRLSTVLDAFAPEPTPVYAVFMARKHVPLRLRSFIDHLKLGFEQPDVKHAMAPIAVHRVADDRSA